MHTHRHVTWANAAGLPEVSARLDRLPNGIPFSDNFPEPIRFDPTRKRLLYRGFMSSVSYRYLHGLSTDPAYVSALDLLFRVPARYRYIFLPEVRFGLSCQSLGHCHYMLHLQTL